MRLCPNCDSAEVYGVVYSVTSPNYYDGVSEYDCMSCGSRYGRWTRKKLTDGEEEPRFGGSEVDPEAEEIGEYTKPEIKEL